MFLRMAPEAAAQCASEAQELGERAGKDQPISLTEMHWIASFFILMPFSQFISLSSVDQDVLS